MRDQMKYLRDGLSLSEAASMVAEKLDLLADEARKLLVNTLVQNGHVESYGRLGLEYNQAVPGTEYRRGELDWARSRCGRFEDVEVDRVRLDQWIAAKLQRWDSNATSSISAAEGKEKLRHAGGRSLDTQKEHAFWAEVSARLYYGEFTPEPYDGRHWLAFRKEMAQWMSDRNFDVSLDDWIKPRLQLLRTALETRRN
jgi:hypothetical protein